MEDQPGLVCEWIVTTYSSNAEGSKAENTKALLGDKTWMSSQDSHGRNYAPVGKIPVGLGMAKKVTMSIILAAGNRRDV
jgi:hypothetical protein